MANADTLPRPIRLLYMHIPKTAGSSFNSFVSRNLGSENCVEHIESNAEWNTPGGFEVFRNAAYLSGHIRLQEWARKVDFSRYLTAVTLREPYAHLGSHIAWTRRLAEPGNEKAFQRHTTEIQDVARRLALVDWASPDDVREWAQHLTMHERYLFDNHQVRYLAEVPPARAVDTSDVMLAKNMLGLFNIVGITEDLGSFITRIADAMGWPPPQEAYRDNRYTQRFGLRVDDPATREALKPLVGHDISLYPSAQKLAQADLPMLGPAKWQRTSVMSSSLVKVGRMWSGRRRSRNSEL